MDGPPVSTRLAGVLGANETVAWTGRPAQGLRLRAIDAVLIPFSLLWGGFAVFWERSVDRLGFTFFSIVGAAFVAVGLYLIVGRFFYDAYVRANLTYAVTNLAAYVLVDAPFSRTLTYAGASLVPLDLSLARDGRHGTIHFGSRVSPFALGARSGWTPWTPDLSEFTGIADAGRVYTLVRDLVDRV